MKSATLTTLAILMGASVAQAGPADCNRNEVYSSSMKQCISKAAMCDADQVYSSSMGQCIPKAAMCDARHVFRNGRCVWRQGE